MSGTKDSHSELRYEVIAMLVVFEKCYFIPPYVKMGLPVFVVVLSSNFRDYNVSISNSTVN